MKKITLALLAAVCSVSAAYSQVIVQAPLANNSTSEFRAPNGSVDHTYLRNIMYISAGEMFPLSMATINSFSFQYTKGATTTNTGNITVYMQNTPDLDYNKGTNWTTAITGMATAYVGTYTVPNTPGAATVGITFTTPFPYTGGAVYIAWDWASGGPFSATTATYLCNNTKTQCYTASSSVTPIPTALTSSNFRPSLLFSAINTTTLDAGVLDIVADGKVSKQFGVSQLVSANVWNPGSTAINNLSVSLNVGGANPFTTTTVIPTIAPAGVALVNFAGFACNNSGINTITVSILSPDQNSGNNTRVWTQSVTCNEVGTVPPVNGSAFITTNAYGNGTGAGFIYTMRYVPAVNCSLTAARLVIANLPTYNIGHPVTAMLLDNTGAILATGSPVNTTAGMLGTWTNFNFITPQALTAGTDYYIGAAVSSPTFYPMAILNNTYTPYFTSPGFFTSPISGGSLAQIAIDYFGIEGVMTFTSSNISVAATTTILCKQTPAITITLTASGANTYTWSVAGVGNGSTAAVTPTLPASQQAGQVAYSVVGNFTTGPATGCKTSSAVITVSLANCTGVMDADESVEIAMFPNPAANGKTTISGLHGTNTIAVFTIMGQMIMTQTASEESVTVDLGAYPAGNYLVKITNSENKSKTMKLVRQE